MARVYSANVDHAYKGASANFVNGVAAVPSSDTVLTAWLTAQEYDIVPGSDTLGPWDYLTHDQLVRFAVYCGIDPAEKNKKEIIGELETALIAVAKYAIAAFDAIPDVDAGAVADPIYADAAAVQAILPESVKATLDSGMVADVPVTAWVDTDTYNSGVAGSYTFTATLGTVPTPYVTAVTATVEVIVGE